MRLIDLDVEDLELLAEAAEAEASRFRVAAEAASAEVSRLRAAKEDVRTRSVRIVEVLGNAGRLVGAAAALRASVPAPQAQQDSPGPTAAAAAPKASTGRTAPLVEVELDEDDPGALTLARLKAKGTEALGPDATRSLVAEGIDPAALAASSGEEA